MKIDECAYLLEGERARTAFSGRGGAGDGRWSDCRRSFCCAQSLVDSDDRGAFGQAEGIVYIYGNYSGDVLNFDFAAEELENEGKKVVQIRVHDDIASAPVDRIEARRGTAGDIFVFRCVSAAADRSLSLEEVLRVGEKVNARMRSIGVALGAASSIDTGEPMFDLPIGSIEIGMGLHGEMGVSRADFEPAETLVPKMIELLMQDYLATQTPWSGWR